MATRDTPVTPVRYDPFAYETHEDPFPVYRLLRDEAPVSWNPDLRFWALSRYDDVRAALMDWGSFTSTEGITLERKVGEVEPMLIEMDPPRHTALRAIVSRAFTARRLAELEEPMRALARSLVDAFAGTGRCDLIADLSAILPMAVIARMLAIPESDHPRLREWTDAMLHREPGRKEVTTAGIEGATHLYAYFDSIIRQRRRQPGDDLVSSLLSAEVDGHALAYSEILGFCFLLVIAGNETTTKLIGNAVYWLARNPDTRARLLVDPSLIPAAVEETLRYDGSTQVMARACTTDIDLHGQRMHPGDKVLLLLGSANRDERFWDEPDRFDLDRNPAGHLAFGQGIHHCLGAPLARLESRVALEELLPKVGEYEVDEAGAERVHSGNVRGFAHLPLVF